MRMTEAGPTTAVQAEVASAPVPQGALSPRAPARRSRRKASTHPLWFLGPAIVMFGIFFLLPNLLNFGFPFTDWSAFHSSISFIGLANFREILSDGSLFKALRATLLYSVLVAVFYNVAALSLALLLERDTWYNRAFRSLFFLPVLLSALAVGYIFRALLDPDGALNAVLSHVLGHAVTTAWLGSTTWTIVVVAAIHAWKWTGLGMLVYLAGLKSIPPDLLDAAAIDGASRSRTFWKVRFPLLAPAVTFNVATGFISTLNSFDIVQATRAEEPTASPGSTRRLWRP